MLSPMSGCNEASGRKYQGRCCFDGSARLRLDYLGEGAYRQGLGGFSCCLGLGCDWRAEADIWLLMSL